MEHLERYKQEAVTAAAYMDMKARHFAAFLVLNGALVLAAFEIDALQRLRLVVSIVAITVTLLFMRLDGRTGAYLRGHLSRSESALREVVGESAYVAPVPASRFGASAVSTAIYGLVVAVWSGIALITSGVASFPEWACDRRPAAPSTAGHAPTASRPAVLRAPASAMPQETKPPAVRLAC